MSQQFAHPGNPERMLRHKHRVGAAGDAAVRCDPAGVTAHHFDDHDSVVRFRSGMQTVDSIGDNRYRGVEAEREVSSADVIVNRLWDADEIDLMILPEVAGGR